MKKRLVLNICMVLTIVLIAVCGVMAVGSVKGWFDKDNLADFVVSEKKGIALVERNGISYETASNTLIKMGDKLHTKASADLTISNSKEPVIYLGENTTLSIGENKQGLQIGIEKGEALIDSRNYNEIIVVSNEMSITLNEAVATISKQAGSSMVYVYAGEVLFHGGEKDAAVVSAGEIATMVMTDTRPSVSRLNVFSLNDVQIAKLMKVGVDETFAFGENDLKKVQVEREAETLKAQQEAIKLKEEAKKETDSKKQTSINNAETISNVVTEESSSNNDIVEGYYQEEIYEEEIYEEDEDTMSCTIKIVCDTILGNMDQLDSGKEAFVPSSGTILGTTSVEFYEGETVFDVLKRVCDSAGIQLEYAWTPMYDSYYIEGINHLYEFDCGSQSGWMYKVNGWFPNYGCSSYSLKDGDTIVWGYTCNYGDDIGGGNF